VISSVAIRVGGPVGIIDGPRVGTPEGSSVDGT